MMSVYFPHALGRRLSGSGGGGFEPFADPKLDDGLARDAEAGGFVVERGDHPLREIDVDALDHPAGPAAGGQVEVGGETGAGFVEGVEFTGGEDFFIFHDKGLSPWRGRGARR